MKFNNWKNRAIGVLFFSCTLVATAEADESRFYAEVALGRSSLSDDGPSSIDENATGFRVAAGYQFVRWFAVDVGYVDFGTVETDFIDIIGPPVAIEARANGLELGFVGRIPLGDRFTVTGRVEKLWWNSNVESADLSQSDSGSEFAYGLGAEMTLSKQFIVSAAWQKYDLADIDIDMLTLGLRFQFGGGTSK